MTDLRPSELAGLGRGPMRRPTANMGGMPDDVRKMIRWGVIGFMAFVTFILLSTAFYQIDAGERGILLTFGKPNDVAMGEGLHMKVPIMQSIAKMDVKTQKYEADAEAASKDLQVVNTKVAVNYHLVPDTVPTLYKEIGIGYQERIIEPFVQEVVKASTAQFTAEELITDRPLVKQQIESVLREKLLARGIVVEQISITNFDFSESFNQAIESKVTAQQTSLKAKNDLERIKTEAEQVKAAAMGQKEAAIATAEGAAAATKLNADAQAYSLRVIREELEKSNNLIQYKAIEKWSGTLPQYMLSSTTPFLQIPAGSSN